jgi:DNA-binding transcriptional regulator YdaS (Cro superfamily)
MSPTDLRSFIAANGYSVRGLARALGVAHPQVSKWLYGVRPIPEHHAAAIIRLTDAAPVWRPPAPSSHSRDRSEARQPRAAVERNTPDAVNLWSGLSEAFKPFLPSVATAPVAAARRPSAKPAPAVSANAATGPLHSDFVTQSNAVTQGGQAASVAWPPRRLR